MSRGELDWVVLRVDIQVKLCSQEYTIDKGTLGRVLRINDDGTLNVSFGMTQGIHALSRNVLEPRP